MTFTAGLVVGALTVLALFLAPALFRRPRILDPRYHSPRAVNESIDRARATRSAPCQHRPVTTSAGPFCEKCGAEL